MTSSILFTYQPHSEKISLGKIKIQGNLCSRVKSVCLARTLVLAPVSSGCSINLSLGFPPNIWSETEAPLSEAGEEEKMR